jgi:hypothetical protein
MMRISFIILLILCCGLIHGQPVNGAYRNSVDYNKRTPMMNASQLRITLDYHPRVPDLYKVTPLKRQVKRKTIRKEIWCICVDSNLYLNAERIGMVKGYIKITGLKKYSYFRGIPVKTLYQQARQNDAIINFGVTGALVTEALTQQENQNKIHYVLNTETGMINLFNRNYMLRVLQPHKELLFNFNLEPDYMSTYLKYLDILNRIEGN